VTDVRAGDLCSIASGDVFKVAKVLRVADEAVHVRVYAERFLSRPVAVAPEELTLGSVDLQSFGIGHLPLARAEFERWKPVVIAHGKVDPEELEGYELWAEAAAEGGAGVWGAQAPGLLERLRAFFGR
jgi:hypothetical protein